MCSSSTFKDPERASLRDSGHGDSDQADSDQDTNKGSCCDMSAKEALKLKATGVKPPPLEQGETSLSNRAAWGMNVAARAWHIGIKWQSIRVLFFHPGASVACIGDWLAWMLAIWTCTWPLYSPLLCSLHFSHLMCVCVWEGVSECAFYTRPQFIKADKPIMFL